VTQEATVFGPASNVVAEVLVFVGEDRLTATAARPLVFGRADVRTPSPAGDNPPEMQDAAPATGPAADAPSVIGLDPQDMGISARTLSVEFDQGVWWLANLSAKRNLLLDPGYGSALITFRPGQRHAIAVSPLGVLVPGAIFTHRVDVHVPDESLAMHRPTEFVASGTITGDDLHLTKSDREALAAVFSPLLQSWPRRGAHPLSYQEAADLLGTGWTGTAVRKHFERVRQRLADSGTFFDGSHAKDDLGQYLLDNAILSASDLESLARPKTPPAAAGDE
jgi:hypothetical protein